MQERENKTTTVVLLEQLLKHVDDDIVSVKTNDEIKTVFVTYVNGFVLSVDVRGDSPWGIVTDVINAIDNH